jgi:hypothetical protein
MVTINESVSNISRSQTDMVRVAYQGLRFINNYVKNIFTEQINQLYLSCNETLGYMGSFISSTDKTILPLAFDYPYYRNML